MYLLDVAVGPIYLILGLGFLLVIAIVVGLVVFSLRAIKKIRQEQIERESTEKKQ